MCCLIDCGHNQIHLIQKGSLSKVSGAEHFEETSLSIESPSTTPQLNSLQTYFPVESYFRKIPIQVVTRENKIAEK